MTEVKKIVTSGLEDKYIDALVEKNAELKEEKTVPQQKIFKKKSIDYIEKKRSLKKWKKSFGYYCLNPHRFNFRLRDL